MQQQNDRHKQEKSILTGEHKLIKTDINNVRADLPKKRLTIESEANNYPLSTLNCQLK